MTYCHIKKPSGEVVQYFENEIKSPLSSFERLRRIVEKDGDLTIVTYSVSEQPVAQKSFWSCCFKLFFCCSKPSEETSLIGRAASVCLKEDLDKLRPINRLKASVKKIIFLRLAAGMEKIARKHEFKGLMVHPDYWCEAIHPERYTMQLSGELFRKWSRKNTEYSFEEWLRTSEGKKMHTLCLAPFRKKEELCSGFEIHPETEEKIPKVDLTKITIKEFDGIERGEYQVTLDRSNPEYCKLIKKDGTPLSGVNIFVIDPELNLYAAPKIDYSLHHSSFLSRGAVVFAGTIELTETGIIHKIKSFSGHYRPSTEGFINGLKALHRKGLNTRMGEIYRLRNNDPRLSEIEHYEWSREIHSAEDFPIEIPSPEDSPICPTFPPQNIFLPPSRPHYIE